MMEDLEDLELEDMKALGPRIEKCVDEVLRSHLVERPLNTTKNYIPKQKEWKAWCEEVGFVLATPTTSRTTGSTRASSYSSPPSRS